MPSIQFETTIDFDNYSIRIPEQYIDQIPASVTRVTVKFEAEEKPRLKLKTRKEFPSIDEFPRVLDTTDWKFDREEANEVVPEKTVAQRQREAFERFFTAIDAIDDEPITDEDLNKFTLNRVNFIRELDL